MAAPTLCMIFESVTNRSAIAKIALAGVRIALNAGWRVTVAAIEVDDSIRGSVEWIRFGGAPRGFALKWLTARHFIRAALGNRQFDVVHAHQPQVADLADVFQCHYLTRVAHERGCVEQGSGLGALARRAQHYAVLRAEDRYYRHWNPRTRMLFNSELTRQSFARLYGMPQLEQVLVYPFPALRIASKDERRKAREALVGTYAGPVVGYLGGVQERKGYRRLISALVRDGHTAGSGTDGGRSAQPFLLFGGPYGDHFDVPELRGRFRAVGTVSDTETFYAACDVLAVPSYFEPLGLVAFEAAARGIPVLATDEVGALPHLLQYGAGRRWIPAEPLAPLVLEMADHPSQYVASVIRMAHELSEQQYGHRLIAAYNTIGKRDRIFS